MQSWRWAVQQATPIWYGGGPSLRMHSEARHSSEFMDIHALLHAFRGRYCSSATIITSSQVIRTRTEAGYDEYVELSWCTSQTNSNEKTGVK